MVATYVHVDDHAVALGAVDVGRDHNQGVLGHEVPYTPLPPVGARMEGIEFEFKGLRGSDEESQAAEVLQ